MKHLKKLHVQVILALLLAVALGLGAPQTAMAMKPLGQGFIALLKMLLAPIVFCTVVHGIAHARDLGRLGRLGFKTLVYFEVVSTLAMAVGFVLVNVFEPGAGLHATNLAEPEPIARAATAAGEGLTFANFALGMIPHTLVDAFARGDILQVLVVSILAGIALNQAVGADSVILRGIDEGQKVLFKILGYIMRLAPIGAFGAMAAAVGSYGGTTLLYLMKLVVLYYAASLFFVFVVLGAICWYAGFSLMAILRLIKDELLLVLGTASGEVAFPRLVVKLKNAGCDEMVVGFVLPAGYSFNLDGTSIYMAIAIGFIAQATDTPFSLMQQVGMLAVLMLTSKGGTTVAGGAFIKLAATLQTLRQLPLGGLGLLFGIDRLLATATATVNMVGNVVAVFALARWEGGFDQERYRAAIADAEKPSPEKTT
ncbi:cation:dicarboxylate symporter family transporter [Massilia horti]|uniref:Cation:dicarboxylase symporter family transporter n=1 Tax=Massilia horti TaxID=2562153 RepID=A0A4Y9TAB4_9BURK|nr:cation:dicarboxylase symporter family transporter [Massilia horti]TFW35647.1 cation:dicarboxylase symporter family transporter [Massilia horti]